MAGRFHRGPFTNTISPSTQNWFQNRRAKKKQELKAKELEANAEAEKGMAKREETEAFDIRDNLSTADEDEPAVKTEPRTPETFENETSATGQTQSRESPQISRPCSRNHQPRCSSTEVDVAGYKCEGPFGFASAEDTAYYTPHSGEGVPGIVATSSADFNSGLAPSVPMGYSMEASPGGLEDFSYAALMYPGLPDGMGSYQTRGNEFHEDQFPGYHTESVQGSIEPNQQTAVSPDGMDKRSPLITQPFRLRSPPAVDIAGRRKRPGLNLSGIRSTSNGPATGIDFGRRTHDAGSPMRRITSATGYGFQGLRRFPSQHRGGVFDRRQESLLHAARSPNMTSLASAAPPTPDTPVVVTHQSAREATVSSNSSEDDGSLPSFQPTGVLSQHSALDQSVRTPPATPIGLGDVFATSIGASLTYPATEESFLAPEVDTYSMRTNEFPIPSYVADGYMTHPSTPQIPMSTDYYTAMPTSNAEYRWTDGAMVSTKSSPNPHQMRQLQFSNVTPQDFSGSK